MHGQKNIKKTVILYLYTQPSFRRWTFGFEICSHQKIKNWNINL